MTRTTSRPTCCPEGNWYCANGADLSPQDEEGHGSLVSGTVPTIGNSVGAIVGAGVRVVLRRVNLITRVNQRHDVPAGGRRGGLVCDDVDVVKPIKKVIDNFAYGAGGWRVGKHPRLVPGPA